MALIVGNSKIFADNGASGQKFTFKQVNEKKVF